MSSRTEHLHNHQINSSSFVVPDIPNPRDVQSTNDDIFSILPSNADIFFIEAGQLYQISAPLAAPLSPLLTSQETRPPSASEGANADNMRRLQQLGPPSTTSTPTPSTALSALGNLDTFVQSLTQDLPHGPNASVTCSVKQNDEPENVRGGPLEQRLEKKMNVQLSVIPPLRVRESNYHLVIGGEITRRIFGGVGHYHSNQSKPELVQIIKGSNFSSVVGITSGRTVSIGFKFTTYPRQCDPSEEAFRVVATLHDCGGQLVAYGMSASAYSIKSHARGTKRSRQASTDDAEDTEHPRTKRRGIVAVSSTSIPRNHTRPSNSSAAGSSGQHQSGDSANTGGLPVVELTANRSEEVPQPMIDPQSHLLPHEPYGIVYLNPTEGYQPMPTLDEVVPQSCSWRGGIFVSLFVSNLPPDGHIYARFGYTVVKTDRKTPHVLGCRVPATDGPCEVDVTLSKSSGAHDAPYGLSLCKFTYEEDDITRLVRYLRADAHNSNSLEWQAATAVEQHAMNHRLIPARYHANQSTHNQPAWSLPGHARLEVVEEEGNDEVQPEHFNNVPILDITFHGPSKMEYECGDVTGVESSGTAERIVRQDMEPLDIIAPRDSEGDTTLRSISKPNVPPTPKLKKPDMLNSPTSATQKNKQARPERTQQVPPGNERPSAHLLDCAPPTESQPLNLQTGSSHTGTRSPTIAAQTLPTAVVRSEPISINSTPSFSAVHSVPRLGLLALPKRLPLEIPQEFNLDHSYDDFVHPPYRHIRLERLLKDPNGCQQNSTVFVRPGKSVVLEVHLQAEDGRIRNMGWQGIALPRTPSVKQSDQPTPAMLLHFSIEVYGSTTGMTLTQLCDSCWRREMRLLGNSPDLPQYLIDISSESPVIHFSSGDALSYVKTEVTFHFTCYSNHQKEDYELVVKLHDEQGNLVAYYQIPYCFKSVARPDRVRDFQDDYPSIVHPPVVSPAATTVTFQSGSSNGSLRTASLRSTVSAFSQRTAPLEGPSIRHLVPPLQHPLHRENVEARSSSFGADSRTDIQQPRASDELLLQRVTPIEGPTRGGLNIVLIGTDFPRWQTVVYVRFGSAVAATSWINQSTLECTLPTSPVSGLVDVTLSLSPDHNAPKLGRSSCTFTYRDEHESFLLMLRSVYDQVDEPPRVALDVLVPQVLHHASPEAFNRTLRRLAQNQDDHPPIDEEELGMRFLASISRSQGWSNKLSFADENHQTITHLCVLSGYTRLLTQVINWGIDLDVQDMSGLTALHCAYLREDWDCVRILREAGAGEYIRDNLGRIPREVCQHVGSEGTVYSEREVAPTPARFPIMGEQVWMTSQLPWRSPSDIKATGRTYTSPMLIHGPSSGGSFNANDDSWIQSFSNLQISESALPLTRPSSIITSSSGRRRGGTRRYGWSHLTSSPGVQRNVSSGTPEGSHYLLARSSAFLMPQPGARLFSVPEPAVPFLIPEPAVPFPIPKLVVSSFQAPEPTGIPEDINHYANPLPSLQRGSRRMVPYIFSSYHTPAQTSLFHDQDVTYSNIHAVLPRQRSLQGIQPLHHPAPSATSIRYAPPPCSPPPPHYVSLEGAFPSSPPHLSQHEDEKAAISQMATKMWPIAEEEKVKHSKQSRMEKRSEKGALADPEAFTVSD